MIIDIDLTGAAAAIELVTPEDCKTFHVAARGGSPEVLAAALVEAGVGRLLPSGDAMIDTQAIGALAAARAPAGWDDNFTTMLEYAKSKGWLDDTDGSVQAHVEWAT